MNKTSSIARAVFLSSKFFSTLLVSLTVSLAGPSAYAAKPKYPADVKPLSLDNSYFQRSAAPDYWKLNGFLVRQISNSACSLAAVTLVLNGARGSRDLDQGERVLTQPAVLKATNRLDWSKATATDGGGVSIRELKDIAATAVEKNGLHANVENVCTGRDDVRLERFRDDLRDNERTSSNFIIVNFDQSAVMEDAEPAGHFAAVGAYDATTDRVLILDPDKDWFEPYWVPTRRLFEAMGKTRGYLKFQF